MTKILQGAIIALVFATVPAVAAPGDSLGQWDAETLDTLGRIPVQEDGRVKPLSTLASFKLLKLNGMRAYRPESGGRLDPMEWMLDCLFYPDETRDYTHFSVDNSEVVTAIGAEAKGQRDRYSYNELAVGRDKLFQLAREFSVLEDKERSAFQRQVLNLAHNINDFDFLIHFLDFARAPFPTEDSRLIDKIFPGRESLMLSDLLAEGEELQRSVQAIILLREEQTAEPEEQQRFREEEERFVRFFDTVQDVIGNANALALVPPSDPDDPVWKTPSDLLGHVFSSTAPIEGEIEYIAALEALTLAVETQPTFSAEVTKFSEVAVRQAKARGEYSKVPIEVSYYNGNFFFYAQWLFVLSSILVAFGWLFFNSKALNRAAIVAIVVPWVLLVTGITYRCIIRSRPPISTLYETILFITAVVVLVAMAMEYLNRQRIGLAIAAFMGTFGLFLAYKFEMNDKQDTMPELVAVLDTNFWLSTHVTSVTTGYAAGLLSGAIGIVYIVARLFRFKQGDKTFYKTLSRMLYGILCFGLLFSFVGTVLGGIWANYSWGRFWGWDPKENGALLIVLWYLAMLHGRMGGYLRDLGMSMAAVFGGVIVSFSWWGVNLLGVGLHSYGFTSGIWGALKIFWLTQAVVLLAGTFVYFRDRSSKDASVAVESVAN